MKKYCKIGISELSALIIIIIGGVLLRFFLISQNWPMTNSDEGIIGLMARHIAYNGEHPTFYYGQNYMGALQAYLGAGLFQLFGPSLFVLRLGLLLMVTLFLISMYLMTRLLYSKGLALITVAVLSLGSSYVLARQLSAIGGYPETLLFSSLVFLFASALALTAPSDKLLFKQGGRWLGYGCWGLAAGLGLWSDLLVLPFVMMSGLLILLFCWRELLRIIPALFLLLGLVIGAFPLINYNLHAAPGQDSLSVLIGLQGGSQAYSQVQSFISTLQVSLPMMTGNPFCPVTELPFLGPTSSPTLQCNLIHGSWSAAYLILFASAVAMALWALWRFRRRGTPRRAGAVNHAPTDNVGPAVVGTDLSCPASPAERATPDTINRSLQSQVARLLLLGAAALTFIIYAHSNAPIYWPGIRARYLIGLLVATPALLRPLWHGIRSRVGPDLSWARRFITGGHDKSGPTVARGEQVRRSVCASLLLLFVAVSLIGSAMALGEIPAAQADHQNDKILINHLVSIGATHIYTDYWTCARIAFVSQEKIICGVIDDNLQPNHNRDPRYYDIVSADPRSVYVFHTSDRLPAVESQATGPGARYRRSVFDGYNIYQPVS